MIICRSNVSPAGETAHSTDPSAQQNVGCLVGGVSIGTAVPVPIQPTAIDFVEQLLIYRLLVLPDG